MKKLVCAEDVEALKKQGKKVFYIEDNTIITPSAKDIAKACGIEFSVKSDDCSENHEMIKACDSGIDSDMIYKALKAMMEKGLLKGVFDSVADAPYMAEKDSCGLKIVRGNSVKYEVLDTGNPSDKVFYQEIMNADDGCSMNAGFITIEGCTFDWDVACEELYHIVEGTLTVTVDGKGYTVNPGDSVFFPKGVKVSFGSPNKMKA
ncbi:MAG: cupin domain-containing protein, partial [Clostridia bacterium]|nr:cupin domain-containing protein [Clostridia bacterium]